MGDQGHTTGDPLLHLPVAELAGVIRAREVTSREVVAAFLAQADAISDHNAFIQLLTDDALERAAQLDGLIGDGQPPGPLHGVPMAVKDNIAVAGYPTTAGTASRRASGVAASSAPAVRALVDAGAVVIGLTNMHEWACGPTSKNPFFGSVHNPWDSDRVAGGSSGGSAVAVALRAAAFALGTDTGGSVRIPSSMCGTAALKVTTGALPMTGVLPISATLDSLGPMAITVEDLALPFAVLSRAFPAPQAPRRVNQLGDCTFGIDRTQLDGGRLDPEVLSLFETCLDELTRSGARLREVSIPLLDRAWDAQVAVSLAEAAMVHSDPSRMNRSSYSREIQELLAVGDAVTKQEYVRAQQLRPQLLRQYLDVFEEVDLLVSPTTPLPATPIELSADAEVTWPDGSRELLHAAIGRLTFPSNLAGVPSLSLPCGLTDQGLPVGLQLVGRPWSDSELLTTGTWIETIVGGRFTPPMHRP